VNPAAPCAWQVVMITWRELFAWRRNGALSTKWAPAWMWTDRQWRGGPVPGMIGSAVVLPGRHGASPWRRTCRDNP
jgi:hypothetical protein